MRAWVGLLALIILASIPKPACAATSAEIAEAAARQTRARLARRAVAIKRDAADVLAEAEMPTALRASGEPPLRQAARAKRYEGYRLTWVGANGESLVVRVRMLPSGSAQVILREFALNAPVKTRGSVVPRVRVSLAQAYLRMANVWRTPAADRANAPAGSRWSLEVAAGGNYRWLSRQTPVDQYFLDAAVVIASLADVPEARLAGRDPRTGLRVSR